MFNRYFHDELANLRDLGEAFSKAYPAVAPMLSGPTADPDVERLLEGVAFLTGLLRQKLDDEFPEIIHELIRLLWPHYLRPVPCATIVAFKPRPTVKTTMTVPAGVQLSSVPVEGTQCLFRTCYDVELHPLHLLDATFVEASGSPPVIALSFELRGISLSDWQPQALRLFLSGSYANAADLYLILRHYLKHVVVTPEEEGSGFRMTRENLKPVGFSNNEQLIPYPVHSFPGYRVLQEYFLLPEKFLFLDLVGWERWQDRGEGTKFEIRFELETLPLAPPRVKRENFILSATPAINVFPFDADPIRLDHRGTEYPVRPAGSDPSHYQVYAFEKVVGFVQGTAEERTYLPFEVFNPEPQSNPLYHLHTKKSPLGPTIDTLLSVTYPQEAGVPSSETLSIRLLCTNGSLPENLQVGDISQPTSNTPEYVDFENIRPPTTNILPPLGSNLLWRLLSHLSLNYVSLQRPENLQALLELYVFPEGRERPAIVANKKRIAGIQDLRTEVSNRLVSGIMMRGQEITLRMRQDHFAGAGDLFVFGCMIDYFFGAYASINSYTQLIVDEVLEGERYKWPPRVGDHPLI
jgi:type VI secretion system protein ImpG